MTFHDPLFLALIVVVIPLLLVTQRKNSHAGIVFSSNALLEKIRETFRVKAAGRIFYLRVLAALLMILALARPQAIREEVRILKEGIDIVIALDVSTSMLAEDFQSQGARKNRLAAAKEVIESFAQSRESDRIGMVVFASRAYPACPLTLDHDWLRDNLKRIETGMIEDGTAIGSGLMSAVGCLRRSDAKSRVVILLSDGRMNAGEIDPETAAAAARALGVKVYTIGIGSHGPARYPVTDPLGRTIYKDAAAELDEGMLKMIALKSGGRYYRATDMESLKNIYHEIDGLEKTRIEEKAYRHTQERFPLFVLAAVLILILEIVLRSTLFRTVPS